MDNMVLFLLPLGTLNDATEYYVDILQESFEKAGYRVSRSDQLKDVRKFKKILTIEAKWFFFSKVMNPSASIVNWFQGIVAEEAYFATNSIFRKKLWHFFEAFTLRYSKLNIYVSDQMKLYFEKNYNIKSEQYFIMPCFNKKLSLDMVDVDKYLSPSFVYAGSLAKWQCIEESLKLYALLEERIHNVSITLLTKEKDYAFELIDKYNIKNYNISYVSLSNLDSELAKYKYGFILREDHIVNNVATPTKMNSYLSVGVIPIYSSSLSAFSHFSEMTSSFIELDSIDLNESANKIIKYESNNNLDQNTLFKDIDCVFNSFYCRENYVNIFFNLVKDTFNNEIFRSEII